MVEGVSAIAGVPFNGHPPGGLMLMLNADSSTTKMQQLLRKSISVVAHFITQAKRSKMMALGCYRVYLNYQALLNEYRATCSVKESQYGLIYQYTYRAFFYIKM